MKTQIIKKEEKEITVNFLKMKFLKNLLKNLKNSNRRKKKKFKRKILLLFMKNKLRIYLLNPPLFKNQNSLIIFIILLLKLKQILKNFKHCLILKVSVILIHLKISMFFLKILLFLKNIKKIFHFKIIFKKLKNHLIRIILKLQIKSL